MSFNKKGFIPCYEQNEPPTLFVLRLSDKPFPYTGRLSKSCYTKAGDGITGRELFLNPETGEIALIFTKGNGDSVSYNKLMNLTFNECKVLKANGFIPEGEEEVFFKGTYNKEDDAFFFNLKEPNQDIYISNCEYKERI